jgi:hypothetical protein
MSLLAKNLLGPLAQQLLGDDQVHDAAEGDKPPLSSVAEFLASAPSRLFANFPSVYFGESGLRLPPVLHYGDLLRSSRKNGLWKRHLSEEEYAAQLGPIFCIFTVSKLCNKKMHRAHH